MDGIINEPDFDLSPTPLQIECEMLRADLNQKEQQLAASQAEKLILIRRIQSALFQEFYEDSDRILRLALSAQLGDQSALREVIAQVLDESAKQGYSSCRLAERLRSGEWTPEVLK